ncbi:NAD-dependent protein deacetylase [Paragonimus heterotremus]|uniref:NAD-dependent protein deacetylase n=1 Tax=Paragonimus heterotremus TaxID=100268 RepID=A0A8J4TNL3_9TREM|nr:NAD-dependent protein deacetylase [Paragonimus heterotremus]
MGDIDLSSLKDALNSECPAFPQLKSLDLEGISDIIKAGKVKNVIVMAGAGISTAAGIPDFRSPQSGIYDNLEEYNLPFPLAVFSIDYFHIDPSPFFKVAKRLYRPDAKPTLTHYFFRLLTEKHLLKRLYTQVRRAYCVQLSHQNVDGLERLAGIDDTVVVEAHGTFNTGHCVKCKKLYDFEYMKNLILDDKIPKCTDKDCNDVVKPDIVFFGEKLPQKFFASRGDFDVCDLLIIIGTSLTVTPFSLMVDQVRSGVPRLYINRDVSEIGFNGIPWDDPKNKSDVVFRGDADIGVTKLAELLGWKDELLELKRKTDAQLGESKSTRAASTSNTGSSK